MQVISIAECSPFFAGQKYCKMLQGVHSAILLTFISLPFAIKTWGLSIFKWPLLKDRFCCTALNIQGIVGLKNEIRCLTC